VQPRLVFLFLVTEVFLLPGGSDAEDIDVLIIPRFPDVRDSFSHWQAKATMFEKPYPKVPADIGLDCVEHKILRPGDKLLGVAGKVRIPDLHFVPFQQDDPDERKRESLRQRTHLLSVTLSALIMTILAIVSSVYSYLRKAGSIPSLPASKKNTTRPKPSGVSTTCPLRVPSEFRKTISKHSLGICGERRILEEWLEALTPFANTTLHFLSPKRAADNLNAAIAHEKSPIAA